MMRRRNSEILSRFFADSREIAAVAFLAGENARYEIQ